VVWHYSLPLMNSVNKTEAAVFSCRLCFLRAFPFISLTCDNASNMNVAARNMDIMKFGCFAQILNLAAGKLVYVNFVRNWLANIRAIVVCFKKVRLAKVVMGEMQTRFSIPEHRLLLDVKTRWNSSYLMVERFVEQYPALLASSADPRLKIAMKTEKIRYKHIN